VDQRLERPRARRARELERTRERCLDLHARRGARRAAQDPRQRQARVGLGEDVSLCASDPESLSTSPRARW
jgi:hypothetical protein